MGTQCHEVARGLRDVLKGEVEEQRRHEATKEAACRDLEKFEKERGTLEACVAKQNLKIELLVHTLRIAEYQISAAQQSGSGAVRVTQTYGNKRSANRAARSEAKKLTEFNYADVEVFLKSLENGPDSLSPGHGEFSPKA